ncbi:MAG TPA: ornithine carbamoyltransferase [Gemmataceae bacterium]|nr:ornithine carbamoyltransferase [Gemmataceae bacterium]
MQHFIDLSDLDNDELAHVLAEAARIKAAFQGGDRTPLLPGRVLGLVFEKPSLRTRVSFEAGMAQLGGRSIFLGASDGAIGQRESVADFARTLSEYVDVVALRVFWHRTLEEFVAHSRIPVVNALSDLAHPCQALGDLLTIQEVFGSAQGRTIVFVGDGNNVARSLALACGKVGGRFILAAPDCYRFDDAFLREFRRQAPNGVLAQESDPDRAVASADVIYTDVWTSMGQEAEREHRLRQFAGFQVDAALMAKAPKHARLMHCLPAHRGEEVSADAIDGERSIVFQQAGNRMHAQKAVMTWLLA